jgi:hypothetical protein
MELDLNQGGVLRKWYFPFNNLLCGHSAKCCDIPEALSACTGSVLGELFSPLLTLLETTTQGNAVGA